MRIQPIDVVETNPPPVPRSRFRWPFERYGGKDSKKETAAIDLGPSSVCLGKMVRNYIEENNEKPLRCDRTRCICSVAGDGEDISDDNNHHHDAENLKSLVAMQTRVEWKLWAYVSKFVETSRLIGEKNDSIREKVTKGLISQGFDASICNSSWEKSSSVPAGGVHKYVDVITAGGDRVLIDIDFRSEFEIKRTTESYSSVLQELPRVYVGMADRLQKIVAVVSEAAKQSMKRRGLHVPPWRRVEYVRAKWLSPYETTRASTDGRNAGGVFDQTLVKCGEHEVASPVSSTKGVDQVEDRPAALGKHLVLLRKAATA